MSIKDALKALAQTLLNTQEAIPGDSIAEVIDHIADTYAPGKIKLAEGTPVNAKAAAVVMTINGVAVHGEKVAVGAETYQFAADEAQTVDAGAAAVDITTHTTKSEVNLTLDNVPTLGNTFTLGEKEYTVVPDGTANGDGEVSIGTDLATFQANVIAAINGTDGHNTPHPLVSCGAFANDVAKITALIGGVAGDAIASTSTFTAGTNKFSAATLGSGADCSKANAKTALLAALEDSALAVGATAAGDTLTLTAAVNGKAGNDIAISTTMANGSFAEAATKLAGGVDGTVGEKWQTYVDASYLYVCVAANTITGTNWRRASLGAAY